MSRWIDCTNASKSSLFIDQVVDYFSTGEIDRRLLCVFSATNFVAGPTTPSSKYLKGFGLDVVAHEISRTSQVALFGPSDLILA